MALTGGPAARWRVHAVLPDSVANGPGRRFVIWSQGCTLACPGCFNPDTHDPAGAAREWAVGELVAAALAAPVEGVTLTGGEPLQQPGAVAAFGRELRARSRLGSILLTGFTRREIEADPARSAAVATMDLVVAGRYQARRHLGAGLRGSANKTYWTLTDRYTPADLAAVPELELRIEPDGSWLATGMARVEAVR